MRMRGRMCLSYGLSAALVAGISACAAKAPIRPTAHAAVSDETPVPTVPPSTPTPEPEAPPLPTRGVRKEGVKASKGHPIGPVITFFGAVRADGSRAEPESVDKNGMPTYRAAVGSGFIVVVEAATGESGLEPGRAVFSYVANDPKVRPDLEIESDRDLGDGSRAVCDRQRPKIGGIPGIKPQSFAETQRVSDALNDFGCRFETFIESDSSCTLSPTGDYSFVSKDSMVQFCMLVARAYAFPVGDTVLTVRVRDTEGNPGSTKQMRIYRPRDPTEKPPTRKKAK